MKAMILALSPQECEKVFNGDLSVLVRKKFPKDYVGPVLVYCKKDKKLELLKGPALYEREEIAFIAQGGLLSIDDFLNGKVIASFWCDNVEEIKFINPNRTCGFSCEISDDDCYYNINEKECCLSQDELFDYLQGENGKAIHINDLDIFDKPKELWRFKTPKMAEIYKHALKKAREDDYEIGTRIAEGVANDDECANCVELTEMSEYYYGLQRAPSNFCYVEV